MVVLGIKIPLNKKIRIALTTLYGIGFTTASNICNDLGISPNCKTKDLYYYIISKFICFTNFGNILHFLKLLKTMI